jgi:hypothetical protein
MLAGLFADLQQLKQRIGDVTRERPDRLMQLERHLRCREPLHVRGGSYIFPSGPSKRHCRASHRPESASASRSPPQESSVTWPLTHAFHRIWPSIWDAGIADTVLAAMLRDRRACLRLQHYSDNLIVCGAGCFIPRSFQRARAYFKLDSYNGARTPRGRLVSRFFLTFFFGKQLLGRVEAY